MGGFRTLATLLLAALAGSVHAAGPKLACGRASKCPTGLVSEIRVAVDAACPCDAARSVRAYGKCWKPVVAGFVKSLGKKGFPKACRREVAGLLGDTTCGRAGFVLCRKGGGNVCTVAKAKRCKDVFPVGPGFRSCADACRGQTAIPFSSTIELSAPDLVSLHPDPGDGTLVFDAAPAALANVGVGSVLVAGVSPSTPGGLLRIVMTVDRSGDQLTMRTAAAPIQLAYAKIHVTGSHSTAIATPQATAQTFVPLVDFGTKKEFNVVVFDGDGDEETKNDQVAIDGEIGGGFDYDYSLDVDWGSLKDVPEAVASCVKNAIEDVLRLEPPSCSVADFLPETKVTFVVHPQVEAMANVHGAALLGYEKEIPIASDTLPPIIIGPLVFVPKAEIKGDISGGASGKFSAGVHGSATFVSSVTVSSRHLDAPDYQQPKLESQDFGANDTKVSLDAFAKVGVAASLNLLLFDSTGPYATAEPYAMINANILDSPCWNLHAGFDATLGVKVTIPDLLPGIGDVTLIDWQAPSINPLDLAIGDGGCEPPPDDDDPVRPGSGPDAVHLATPTYTPWSRTYASPVDGAQAAFPNNSVAFSELARTIDDRFVRSGFGVQTLTKFDEAGALTWARDLALDGGMSLEPLRVRSATDATLWVLSSLPAVAPIVLTKVAQDGSVVASTSYDVPSDACSVDVTALASDGTGGVYVVGKCSGEPRSFVLHAAPSGATFRTIGDVPSLRVNVVEPIGNDVFLAGSASEGSDALFAFRIGADGNVVYAKRYDVVGCANSSDGIPSAAIVGPLGEVTIAGSGGAEHNGLVLRILPDGGVGFAAFPGFGFGLGAKFLFDSFVELPTTGYVGGGSSVDFLAPDPDDVPSAGLVRMDAVGNVIWAYRYTFGGPGAYSASGHVAVRLSDDGGVVATTLLADAIDPLGSPGPLWAFKPFVKDGTIAFTSGDVTVTPLGLTNLACSMTASDRPVTVTPYAVPSHALTVTSTPANLAVDQQTAN